jgi:hypothetical protein
VPSSIVNTTVRERLSSTLSKYSEGDLRITENGCKRSVVCRSDIESRNRKGWRHNWSIGDDITDNVMIAALVTLKTLLRLSFGASRNYGLINNLIVLYTHSFRMRMASVLVGSNKQEF